MSDALERMTDEFRRLDDELSSGVAVPPVDSVIRRAGTLTRTSTAAAAAVLTVGALGGVTAVAHLAVPASVVGASGAAVVPPPSSLTGGGAVPTSGEVDASETAAPTSSGADEEAPRTRPRRPERTRAPGPVPSVTRTAPVPADEPVVVKPPPPSSSSPVPPPPPPPPSSAPPSSTSPAAPPPPLGG